MAGGSDASGVGLLDPAMRQHYATLAANRPRDPATGAALAVLAAKARVAEQLRREQLDSPAAHSATATGVDYDAALAMMAARVQPSLPRECSTPSAELASIPPLFSSYTPVSVVREGAGMVTVHGTVPVLPGDPPQPLPAWPEQPEQSSVTPGAAMPVLVPSALPPPTTAGAGADAVADAPGPEEVLETILAPPRPAAASPTPLVATPTAMLRTGLKAPPPPGEAASLPRSTAPPGSVNTPRRLAGPPLQPSGGDVWRRAAASPARRESETVDGDRIRSVSPRRAATTPLQPTDELLRRVQDELAVARRETDVVKTELCTLRVAQDVIGGGGPPPPHSPANVGGMAPSHGTTASAPSLQAELSALHREVEALGAEKEAVERRWKAALESAHLQHHEALATGETTWVERMKAVETEAAALSEQNAALHHELQTVKTKNAEAHRDLDLLPQVFATRISALEEDLAKLSEEAVESHAKLKVHEKDNVGLQHDNRRLHVKLTDLQDALVAHAKDHEATFEVLEAVQAMVQLASGSLGVQNSDAPADLTAFGARCDAAVLALAAVVRERRVQVPPPQTDRAPAPSRLSSPAGAVTSPRMGGAKGHSALLPHQVYALVEGVAATVRAVGASNASSAAALQEAEAQLAASVKCCTDAKAALVVSEAALKEKDAALLAATREADAALATAQQRTAKLEGELERGEEVLRGKLAELAALSERCDSVCRSSEAVQKENAALAEVVQELRDAAASSDAKAAAHAAAIHALRHDNGTLERLVEEGREKQRALQLEAQGRTQDTLALEALRARAGEGEQTIKRLKDEAEDVAQRLAHARRELAAADDAARTLQRRVAAAEDEALRGKAEAARLDEALKQAAAARREETASLEGTLREVRMQNTSHAAEADLLATKLQAVEEQLRLAQAEAAALRAANTPLEQRLAHVEDLAQTFKARLESEMDAHRITLQRLRQAECTAGAARTAVLQYESAAHAAGAQGLRTMMHEVSDSPDRAGFPSPPPPPPPPGSSTKTGEALERVTRDLQRLRMAAAPASTSDIEREKAELAGEVTRLHAERAAEDIAGIALERELEAADAELRLLRRAVADKDHEVDVLRQADRDGRHAVATLRAELHSSTEAHAALHREHAVLVDAHAAAADLHNATEEQLSALRGESDAAAAALQTAEAALRMCEADLESVRAEHDAARVAAQKLTEEARGQHTTLTALKEEHGRSQDACAAAEEKLGTCEAVLAQVRGERDALEAELGRVQQEYKDAKKSALILQERLDAVAGTNAALTECVGSMKAQIAAGRDEVESMREALAAAKAAASEQEAAMDDAQCRIAELTAAKSSGTLGTLLPVPELENSALTPRSAVSGASHRSALQRLLDVGGGDASGSLDSPTRLSDTPDERLAAIETDRAALEAKLMSIEEDARNAEAKLLDRIRELEALQAAAASGSERLQNERDRLRAELVTKATRCSSVQQERDAARTTLLALQSAQLSLKESGSPPPALRAEDAWSISAASSPASADANYGHGGLLQVNELAAHNALIMEKLVAAKKALRQEHEQHTRCKLELEEAIDTAARLKRERVVIEEAATQRAMEATAQEGRSREEADVLASRCGELVALLRRNGDIVEELRSTGSAGERRLQRLRSRTARLLAASGAQHRLTVLYGIWRRYAAARVAVRRLARVRASQLRLVNAAAVQRLRVKGVFRFVASALRSRALVQTEVLRALFVDPIATTEPLEVVRSPRGAVPKSSNARLPPLPPSPRTRSPSVQGDGSVAADAKPRDPAADPAAAAGVLRRVEALGALLGGAVDASDSSLAAWCQAVARHAIAPTPLMLTLPGLGAVAEADVVRGCAVLHAVMKGGAEESNGFIGLCDRVSGLVRELYAELSVAATLEQRAQQDFEHHNMCMQATLAAMSKDLAEVSSHHVELLRDCLLVCAAINRVPSYALSTYPTLDEFAIIKPHLLAAKDMADRLSLVCAAAPRGGPPALPPTPPTMSPQRHRAQ